MPICTAAIPAPPNRRPHWIGASLVAILAVTWASTAFTATTRLLLIAPGLEELVFRTGLQETLLRRWPPHDRFIRGLAVNAATACAFAAAHVALRADAFAVLTALPALSIGYLYQRQRRLAPCIALHALFNTIWLLAAGIWA